MAGIDRAPGRRLLGARAQRRRAPSARSRPRADELELVVSASETHNQKNVRRSVAESLVGARDVVELGARGRHRGRGDRVDRVRLPVRGRRRARAGRAARRAPHRRGRRPAVVRRHHRHGHARGGSTTCSTRSSAPASAPIGSGCTSTTRAAPRSRTSSPRSNAAWSRFDASIGGLGGCPYAPGRVRQRGHGGSRAHVPRHGDRDRHRSRRADRVRAARAARSSAGSCRARCCTPGPVRGRTRRERVAG